MSEVLTYICTLMHVSLKMRICSELWHASKEQVNPHCVSVLLLLLLLFYCASVCVVLVCVYCHTYVYFACVLH